MRYRLDPLSPTGLSAVIEQARTTRTAQSNSFAMKGDPGRVQSIVAGTNVTVDSSDPANPIVSATGGSGGGITRTVVVTTGDFTAGATIATDFVYIIAGAHTPTLPTAVGNTNRYTFKNRHSANITFSTTSSQTVDGGGLVIASQESVDLISDNANWRVI